MSNPNKPSNNDEAPYIAKYDTTDDYIQFYNPMHDIYPNNFNTVSRTITGANVWSFKIVVPKPFVDYLEKNGDVASMNEYRLRFHGDKLPCSDIVDIVFSYLDIQDTIKYIPHDLYGYTYYTMEFTLKEHKGLSTDETGGEVNFISGRIFIDEDEIIISEWI